MSKTLRIVDKWSCAPFKRGLRHIAMVLNRLRAISKAIRNAEQAKASAEKKTLNIYRAIGFREGVEAERRRATQKGQQTQ